MGSIQEMPSMEMASESRDVEMRDGGVESEGEGLTTATKALPQAKRTNGISDHEELNHVAHESNGHLTPDDKAEEGRDNSSEEAHTDQPLPSVEKDDERSPSTAAAEQEKTPEGESREPLEAIQSSLAKSRHQHSASVSAPSMMPTSAESIKFEKEVARLNEVLAETSAPAAQKVLHDKWRYFLFEQYDEAHVSFILRAGFKNANPNVTEKVLQDKSLFKELLLDVASRKSAVIEKVLTNATSTQLLHVPQRVLDEALAERLKTVSAKQLIGWLARADRLGYKLDDIIDEDDESVAPRAESVDADMAEVFEVEPAPAPASAPAPAPAPVRAPAPYFQSPYDIRDPLLAEQEKNLQIHRQRMEAERVEKLKADATRQQQRQELRQQQQQQQLHDQQLAQRRPASQAYATGQKLSCPDCRVVLPTISGYNYHTTKKPCRKVPPVASSKWWCENCVQGFTTKQGADYHKLKGVCTGEDIARATSPSKQLHEEAASQARYRPTPPPPASQMQVHVPSITRPPFVSQPNRPSPPATTYKPSEYTQFNQPQTRPEATVQRPPLHTPASTPAPRKQALPSDVRQSPSELSPERLEALNQELQDADDRYEQQIAEIPATYTEAERTARLVSLKNANASRKSQIRKAHGVSLRLREKDKLARKVAGVSPSGKRFSEEMGRTTPTSTPPAAVPTSSFSPINTPPRAGSSASDYGHPVNPPHPSQASTYDGPSGKLPHASQASRHTPTMPSNSQHASRTSYSAAQGTGQIPATSAYRPPPVNASTRVQSPYMAHDPNTLTHALERSTQPGFNVMRIQDLASNPVNPNKRRRSISDEGRPVPPRLSAGRSPLVTHLPNPFTKSPKQTQPQVLIGERVGDARRAQQSEQHTFTAEASKPRNAPIEILSSDSDSDAPSRSLHPAIRQSALSAPPQTATSKPSESEAKLNGGAKEPDTATEKETEKDSDSEPSKPSSRPGTAGSPGPAGRRGFMAKRGGKH